MQQEKFDFFPLNRALSLSAMDEDSTESKVDDLLRQVNMLVERQREEVCDRPIIGADQLGIWGSGTPQQFRCRGLL